MKDFNSKKRDKMTAMRTSTLFPLYPFFYCIDIAFIGGSTPTTAFDGAIYKVDTLNIYMKELSKRKYNF